MINTRQKVRALEKEVNETGMSKKEYIKTPIRYMGNKYSILDTLLRYIPKKIDGTFVDMFMGSGAVLFNVNADRKVGIDIEVIADLVSHIIKQDENMVERLEAIVEEYKLGTEDSRFYDFSAGRLQQGQERYGEVVSVDVLLVPTRV